MDRRPRREDGFTIIEVIVAVFVLVMAALATFGLLSAATKNSERAKATQVALDRAQKEIEALRSLKSEELALTGYPPSSSDPLDPGYRVSSDSYALTREPPGNKHELVINGGSVYGGGEIKGGVVNPGPIPFTSGDVSGKVYRYIVWREDEACGKACPGTQDYKQIVVAVKLDTPGNQAGERGYVEVQSDFIDPTKSPLNDPVAGPQGVVTAQQFFLTDTPCAASGVTVRQEITADHPLHNTLGTCASGKQGGETLGAPDALLLSGPPVPAENESTPPLYDYSNNLVFNPETGRGVQIVKDATTSGCPFYTWPSGTSYPASKVHLWVTDPMASEFKMTGRVTVEFYTRTIDNSERTKGSLCVYLFKRHEEEVGGEKKATDSRLIDSSGNNPYWKYTPENNNWWPSLAWTKERMTMNFKEAPYTIPKGDRLGVAISVESANTQTVAIPIMFDHPTYPSRIEVDTSTPIEGG